MIETERLRLRLWRDEDVDFLSRMNESADFRRYIGPASTDGPGQLERLRAHWDEHGFGQFAIDERSSGRIVGRVGLAHHPLWPDDVELGWGLDPDAWGRGFATEAAAAALAYAFAEADLERIVSLIHPDNAASVRVAEKIGESLLTVLPDQGVDLLVYSAAR